MSDMSFFSGRALRGVLGGLALLALAFRPWPALAESTAPAPTIVVLGDSISAEFGLARDSGWVQLLRDRLKAQHLNYNVVNASISGDTTSNGAARLPALLSQYKPQVLIIELGGNDGLRGLPVVDARSNLEHMVTLAKSAGAKVLITGIQLPPNYGPQYTSQFAGMFPQVASQQHITLVPFLFQGFAEDSDLFQGDRIHPSAAAQPMLLDNVWGPLQPLLR
jgi:acyl-CoA thioesterase-1